MSSVVVTTDDQSVSLSWDPRPDFCYCQTIVGLLTYGALSDSRTGLPSAITAPRQRRYCRCPSPYFTFWIVRLPNLEGQVPVFISAIQGGLVIPPGTGCSLPLLVRLSGLRCKYSNPPPRGVRWLLKLKLKLIYDRRSVGRSVLVSGFCLELITRFLFSA
jgi:hypothetical protein